MHDTARDALRRHGRLIAALCDDLASREFRDRGATPRADAAQVQSLKEGWTECDRSGPGQA